MNMFTTLVLSLSLVLWLAACGKPSTDSASGGGDGKAQTPAGQGDPQGAGDAAKDDAEDHAHDETSIGTITIGEMQVELAQGHGAVEAGEEGHLVVKLPHNDSGATVVRAWIGTEDRTLSLVGKGEYAASHDDYDVHAMAPDPLPEATMWWIESELPDGTKVVGSANPSLK